MTTAKIKLEGVTKSFGDNHVLMGVDLEVNDGESLVLIGGSASGKTLILKCILGLVSPDSGSIKIDGEETVGLGKDEREALVHRMGTRLYDAASDTPFAELEKPRFVSNPLDALLEQSVAFFDTWRTCAADNAVAACPASVMLLE